MKNGTISLWEERKYESKNGLIYKQEKMRGGGGSTSGYPKQEVGLA